MLVERRRSTLSGDFLVRVGVLWLAVAVLVCLVNAGAIVNWRMPTGEDALRLVQVRDLLSGASWFEPVHFHDAGRGVTLSRLVDIPLVAIISPLSLLIGQGAAEGAALLIVPLLTLFLAMLLAARIAWRLVGEEAASYTCIALALSAPFLFAMGPMHVGGEAWQIVFVLLAVNGLMARKAAPGGWFVGLPLAAALGISTSALPIVGAVLAIGALRWLRSREERWWLVHSLYALTAGTAILLPILHGSAALTPACGALGIEHAAGMGLATLVVHLMAKLGPLPRAARLGGFALAAGSGLILASFLAAGACPDAVLVPADPRSAPLWQQDLRAILEALVLPIIGLAAALRLAARSHDWLHRFWLDYCWLVFVALGLAILDMRTAALAAALCAPAVGWQIYSWMRTIRNMRRTGKRAAAMAGMAVALLPALPVMVLTAALPVRAEPAEIGPAASIDTGSSVAGASRPE